MQCVCDSSQNKFVLSKKTREKKLPSLCVKFMVVVPVPGMEIRIYSAGNHAAVFSYKVPPK
jgi:hypothetical protein